MKRKYRKSNSSLLTIITITLFLLFPIHASAAKIEHYTPVTPPACYGNSAILRTFDLEGRRMQLVVDTTTLRTRIRPMVKTPGHPCGDSRYTRLLAQASAAPWPLQNDGITHGRKGLYFTTDLCPSSKQGYERRLYQALIDHLPRPVPVTLFITKRWIDRHPEAFRELKARDRNGSLAITWGNHTARHHYHPGKPLKENFVLSPEENLSADVLELEKNLIERGVTPSVFFRFPGLVSDRKAVETVTRLGLITVGTDAWLAKGQKPKTGSIILLHGNRNEPKGVEIFLKMLDDGKIGDLHPLEELDSD